MRHVGSLQPRHASLAVLAILAVAAGLRLASIGAGLPYRLANDEPFVLGTAVRILQSGDFNPHFFEYGGLTLYLHTFVGAVTFMWGAMAGDWLTVDQFWPGELARPARIVTALIGVATVWVVYRAASRLGQPTALVAALTLAGLTSHVRDSHFALTDIPLTFLVALTWWLTVRAAEDGRVRSFVWAGGAVGLAAATKMPGGVALAMPLLAALGSGRDSPRGPRVTAVVAGAGATFLAASPYTVLALPEFLNSFGLLAQKYNQSVGFAEATVTYLKYLRNWFTWATVTGPFVGWFGVACCLLGLAATAGGIRARQDLAVRGALVLFVGAYFLMLVLQGSHIAGRYALPLAPFLSVAFGVGVVAITGFVRRRIGPAWQAAVFPILILVLLAPTYASSVAWVRDQARTSTIDLAAQWILDNIDGAEPTASEAVLYLPPAYRYERVPRLTDREPDTWRAGGVRYLVTSSAVADVETASLRAVRARLRSSSRVVHVVGPSTTRPGPTITILRLD